MKPFATMMIVTGLLACGTAMGTADDGPAPSRSRIVLHGVDCSVGGTEICPEDRPVIDEAVAQLIGNAPVLVRTDIANAAGNEDALSPETLDAVCEYLLNHSVGPDRITIGSSPVSAAAPPTEVQLSRNLR